MAVHARKQEILDFLLRRGELVGKGGDGAVRAADVVDVAGPSAASRARVSPKASSTKRVMTRRTSSWITRTAPGPGCNRSISSSSRPGNRPPQVVEREQAGAQAVVNVMGVIGDVVGQCRALRLGVGVGSRSERIFRRMQ